MTLEAPGQKTLSPTARKVLDAARVVLLRDGVEGVTLRAVHAEAGVRNGAASIYHFGTKAGLLEALYTEMISDFSTALIDPITALPPEASIEERIHFFVETGRTIYNEPQAAMGLYYSAFSSLLRHNRELLLSVYEEWSHSLLMALFPEQYDDPRYAARLKAVAAVITAIWDGIALQQLVYENDGQIPVDDVFDVIERWLTTALVQEWTQSS